MKQLRLLAAILAVPGLTLLSGCASTRCPGDAGAAASPSASPSAATPAPTQQRRERADAAADPANVGAAAAGAADAAAADADSADAAATHAADAANAADEEAATAATNPPPNIPLSPGLLNRILLAEIADKRGQPVLAAQLMLELAMETRDSRLARRAVEASLRSQRKDLSRAAAVLWAQIDPNSRSARLTLIKVLARVGDLEALKEEISNVLVADNDAIGSNLLHLNRLLPLDPADARDVIVSVTEPWLDRPEAHYARAVAHYLNNNAAAARESIDGALQLRPDWEAAAVFRFQAASADRAAALAELAAFVDANAQAGKARLQLARAYVEASRYEEALAQFRYLLDEAGDAAAPDVRLAVALLSLQLGDAKTAARHLQVIADAKHEESDKARYYLGQIAEDSGRHDEALRRYAAVGGGEHLRARVRGARMLAKLGRVNEARNFLAAARVSDPDDKVKLLIAEAQLLTAADDKVAAHAMLAAALEEDPTQVDLLYETALLAERLGRVDEMESHLLQLLSQQPNHAHALNALGYSLADRNVRLDEALQLIERAIELAPNDPLILDSKGWVLFRLGRNEEALAILDKAFRMRPDAEIAAHLGEVLWVLGRENEARDTWAQAQQINPANEVLAETIKRLHR